ncbi:IS3 family transposase [Komagataeibacter nataicola]|uniref:Integrase catalytic domain-containing protein n=1 Tax=Komagataeibacter nataicola TaxID=265960 RepID=A0ABX5P6K6_9PROT|nr:hypothetical protein CDI09_16700 [Komagataeibacter nataicola]GBR26805.1 hypothetical protein AA0616_3301 [Komagataeibacter nataicola NRIC 0616]
MLRQNVFDYIEMFHNSAREHFRNGMLSPVQFEQLNCPGFTGERFVQRSGCDIKSALICMEGAFGFGGRPVADWCQ